MVIRRTYTRSIKNVVQDFLKENQLDSKLEEQEMMRLWYEITGKMVARATKSVVINNRKMFVRIESSVIRNEISMIRDGLIQELNSRFSKPLIDEIILR
ncbi:MAG: DUF721 domain-containing protein [Bacteroidales bacterium]|nr:DUF721 domain-containing protein [Bacteroidales bacterium]